jgi:hypothetical protein
MRKSLWLNLILSHGLLTMAVMVPLLLDRPHARRAVI